MSCRHHLSQLRQQQARLDELNIRVRIVAFDDDFMAKAYALETKLTWPLLLDRERSLYAAYGMGKGSWWNIYNPISIARYILLILRGKKPGQPGGDWRQMGGDVLIDKEGIVRIHHVSSDPHDRPTMAKIFGMVEGTTTRAFDH